MPYRFYGIIFQYFLTNDLLYRFRKQVVSGRLEAERDNVVVPLTLEDYCKVSQTARSSTSAAAMDSDFYVEDYDLDVESDANSEDEYQDDATDSGNGESWKQITLRLLRITKQYLKTIPNKYRQMSVCIRQNNLSLFGVECSVVVNGLSLHVIIKKIKSNWWHCFYILQSCIHGRLS